MNREEAERALSVIRKVIQNTRDDLVEHNLGLIWMIHAFTNLAACVAGWYLEDRGWPVLWYLVPFAVVGAIDIVIVQFLVRNTPYRWLPLLKERLVHRRG